MRLHEYNVFKSRSGQRSRDSVINTQGAIIFELEVLTNQKPEWT